MKALFKWLTSNSKENKPAETPIPAEQRPTAPTLEPYPVGDVATGLTIEAMHRDGKKTFDLLRNGFSSHLQPSIQDTVEHIIEFSDRIPLNFENFGGSVSAGDMFFTDQFLALTNAKHVLEIGTAFGYSSAFMLFAMHRRKNEGLVTSVDLIDGTKPWATKGAPWEKRTTGSLVSQFFPEYSANFSFLGGRTSLDLIGNLKESADVGFIDAAHFHPWPLIDLLVLSDLLGPGKWILLQDVALPLRAVLHRAHFGYETKLGRQHIGAQLAFEYWPGRKYRGLDGCFNMAAVQVPENLDSLCRSLSILLEYPFEEEALTDDRARDFLKDRMGSR